jgi:hypothetical protein
MLPSDTVHAFWTTAISQTQRYTNETGLLAGLLFKEVFHKEIDELGESANHEIFHRCKSRCNRGKA